jgi:putative N6-adenine-specific DNA methylase
MQPNFQMIAKTLFGLEDVLADELKALGAGNVRLGNRCVYFEGDTGFLYKANLNLRTALRVLKPIGDFRITRPEDFYREVQRISWDKYLNPEMTFVVDTVLNSKMFANSVFVSQKAKDAIADQFRERLGRRPSVSLYDPDLRVHLHVQDQHVHVSLDSSGSSLHLRGYRTETNMAPLNEVLAAGLLLLSGWKGDSDFMDPMCGSGTILIEAAMIACNIPAGIHRKGFGFQRWLDYDEALYQTIYRASLNKTRDFKYQISGTDKAPSAIVKTRNNVKNAGLSEFISLDQTDFFKSAKTGEMPLLLVCNPPYGERLSIDRQSFFKSFGDTLKSGYPNTRAWILVGDPEIVKMVGLRATRKIKLFNGSIESRLALFEIYSGSKKGNVPHRKKFGFT